MKIKVREIEAGMKVTNLNGSTYVVSKVVKINESRYCIYDMAGTCRNQSGGGITYTLCD